MAKIMLVEDDMTMVSLLQTLLQIEGFDVVRSEDLSPAAVMAVMQTETPDVVLLDVHLRQESGILLAKEVRKNTNLTQPRIIMSSGMDFEPECMQAGADDFLMKPYMPDELIKRIRRALEMTK